jgi:hypothetical protein
MTRRWATRFAAWLFAFVISRGASGADPAGARDSSIAPPTVVLVQDYQAPEDALAEPVERHLRAALAARGIGLEIEPREAAIAVAEVHVVVSRGPMPAVGVTVAIADRITHKRIERALDLTAIPEDGRPLAIAASIDELLRASWAELALGDAPPSMSPAPRAVVTAVDRSLRSRAAWLELAIETRTSILHARTAIGGDLRVGAWATPYLGAFVTVGASYGSNVTAPDGSVRADSVDLEAGLAYAPVPNLPFGFDLEASLVAMDMFFVATAAPNARASSFSDGSLVATARGRAWLGSSRIRATASLGCIGALRATRAFDRGEVVTSDEGLGGEFRVGISVRY